MSDRRDLPGGRPPERIRETWVTKPVGDGVWTVGYRVVTVSGVPHIAEQRQWSTGSPPWKQTRLDTPPSVSPNLDRARHAFTPTEALQAWRDENERIDANEPGPDGRPWRGDRNPLQGVPRLYGFDRLAPIRARGDDVYYADVARRYVTIIGESRNYSRALARELGLPLTSSGQDRARKLVLRCHRRGLLIGDELTPYARALLDAPPWRDGQRARGH